MTATAAGGGTAIPPDGAVLLATGNRAQVLQAEAPVGTVVPVRLILQPDWAGVLDALGGGPVLVRDGRPVFRALEDFTTDQVSPRDPRAGVGQLADGRIILVGVDGRQPGYSVGMTTFELAQTFVRLGAVTASAVDSGGSVTVAFDGTLLNRPSDPGGERAVKEALLVRYYGIVAAPPPTSVVSPNGDGFAETLSLSYKVVRPSAVTETLDAPDGTQAFTETVQRTPGRYRVSFPAAVLPLPAGATSSTKAGQDIAEGRWRLTLSAVDEQGQTSTTTQTFWVNDTLGFLKLDRARYVLHPGGTLYLRFGVSLTRAAHVTVTIETPAGVIVRRLSKRVLDAGRARWEWDGHTIGGKNYAHTGAYRVHVTATNAYGTAEVSKQFRVLRAAPAKKPTPRR